MGNAQYIPGLYGLLIGGLKLAHKNIDTINVENKDSIKNNPFLCRITGIYLFYE